MGYNGNLNARATEVITTQGDLRRGDSSGNPERLAVGSANQILQSNGSTESWVTLWSKHVGGYDQTILTTVNTTTASNSMDLKIQFSENGSDWYDVQGYTATNGVAIAGGGTPQFNFDSFATDILHHFYRAQIKATSATNQATTTFFWNLVENT